MGVRGLSGVKGIIIWSLLLLILFIKLSRVDDFRFDELPVTVVSDEHCV